MKVLASQPHFYTLSLVSRLFTSLAIILTPKVTCKYAIYSEKQTSQAKMKAYFVYDSYHLSLIVSLYYYTIIYHQNLSLQQAQRCLWSLISLRQHGSTCLLNYL